MNRNLILGMLLIVAAIVLMSSVFTIQQAQTGVKFRFGQIVGSNYEPGLHFKIPLIENVTKFDARIQTLNSTADERFLTAEKKNVVVDSFAKWKIADAQQFYVSVSGSPLVANQRLDGIIKDGLRAQFSRRTLKEVVSGDRAQIMQILTEDANREAARFGIDVVDVRIRRIDLPEDVSGSVFDRMRAERERVARDFRSRGQEAAERIRANADRQRTVLLAEAYRDAETQRGEGDAAAAETYAKAYSQDSEFYRFYRSLGAYRESFRGNDSVLILDPQSDFFKFFDSLR